MNESSRVSLPWLQIAKKRLTHYLLYALMAFFGAMSLWMILLAVRGAEGNMAAAIAASVGIFLVVFLIAYGPYGTLARDVRVDDDGLTIFHRGPRLLPLYDPDTDSPRLSLARPRRLPAAEIGQFYAVSGKKPGAPVSIQMFPPSVDGNDIGWTTYYLTKESPHAMMVERLNDAKRPWWFVHCEDPEPFLEALAACTATVRSQR